jgi:hypothetical protein
MKKKPLHPNMVLRRVLLDGIKIIAPYRTALQNSHRMPNAAGGYDSRAIGQEIALMNLWLSMARTCALKLKRSVNQT